MSETTTLNLILTLSNRHQEAAARGDLNYFIQNSNCLTSQDDEGRTFDLRNDDGQFIAEGIIIAVDTINIGANAITCSSKEFDDFSKEAISQLLGHDNFANLKSHISFTHQLSWTSTFTGKIITWELSS